MNYPGLNIPVLIVPTNINTSSAMVYNTNIINNTNTINDPNMSSFKNANKQSPPGQSVNGAPKDSAKQILPTLQKTSSNHDAAPINSYQTSYNQTITSFPPNNNFIQNQNIIPNYINNNMDNNLYGSMQIQPMQVQVPLATDPNKMNFQGEQPIMYI